MKNRFKANKIPDDYHTLDRAGQVTLVCLCTGHISLSMYWSQQTQFTHSQKGESSIINTIYLCNRRSNYRTHTLKMTNISENRYGQTEHHCTRSCMGRTREDNWLHSAGWLIHVIKRTRIRLYCNHIEMGTIKFYIIMKTGPSLLCNQGLSSERIPM